METSLFTASNIMFAVGLIGIIFGIYHYFRNPQIKSEKFDILIKQTVEFVVKEFNLKLNNLEKAFVNLKDNHIHTIDIKIGENSKSIAHLTTEVTRLATIIDERIPKK